VKPSRLLTATLLLPILVLLIWRLPALPFFLFIAIVILRVQYEFYRLTLRGTRSMAIGLSVTVAIFSVAFVFPQGLGALIAVATVTLLAAAIIEQTDMQTAATDATGLMAGLLYPVGLLSHLFLIDWLPFNHPVGRGFILFLLAVVWGGDATAYYVGRAMGKRKLAPAISPNKTVAGAIGGLIGSGVIGGGAAFFAPMLHLTPMAGALLGGLLGGVGQVGDLVESMFKRGAGVKDSSALIPAHGGLFDKLDSVAFAAPVLYYGLVYGLVVSELG